MVVYSFCIGENFEERERERESKIKKDFNQDKKSFVLRCMKFQSEREGGGRRREIERGWERKREKGDNEKKRKDRERKRERERERERG